MYEYRAYSINLTLGKVSLFYLLEFLLKKTIFDKTDMFSIQMWIYAQKKCYILKKEKKGTLKE